MFWARGLVASLPGFAYLSDLAGFENLQGL